MPRGWSRSLLVADGSGADWRRGFAARPARGPASGRRQEGKCVVTFLGWTVLVVAAVVVALAAQYLLRTDALPFRWIISAIGAFIGAAAASEWLYSGTTPEYEGIALWPAVVGGLLVGGIVDLALQYYARMTGTHGTVAR